MKPLVDWFCCSFKGLKKIDEIFDLFKLEKEAFKNAAGRWCYTAGLWFDCISVYWVSRGDVDNLTYDVCINMSGQGCRRYETIRGQGFDWTDFFEVLKQYDHGYNVSRIDVALDVKDDSVPDMIKIIKAVDDHKYISQFRRVVTGRGSEEWVYFGSPQSDVRLRIYNKALERKFYDAKWIRFEYQLRNGGADRFLNHILSCHDMGQAFKDFVSQSVKFTKKVNCPSGSDSYNHNSNRMALAKWWADFVKGAGEITKFEAPGVEYNLSALTNYLSRQVSPSLETYIESYGGDITPLIEMCQQARFRMNDKQKRLVGDRQNGNQ